MYKVVLLRLLPASIRTSSGEGDDIDMDKI